VIRAASIAPTHARSMSIKFERLLTAMKYKDLPEADKLIADLLPDVSTYVNQETVSVQISTGIK
jgi:hypothetical protein